MHASPIARRRSSLALPCLLALLAVPGSTAPAAGQEGIPTPAAARGDSLLADALARPGVQEALEVLDGARRETAEHLVRIGGIVSPSGEEEERARAVAERMRAIGLDSVRVTEDPNAIGVIPGRSGRALVFVSTLDDLATVAEHQRAAPGPPRIEGDRVVGPGTNTSLTTVAMLAAAEALVTAGVRPEHDLVFAAVAQEETGLRGMKALHPLYRDRAVAFVDVLGDGHSISYGALGIHWWRIEAQGPPGHTLGGGLPNVNQGIGRAVDRILSLRWAALDGESRTRMNVSILESGTVYNHKPAEGWFSLDLRSLDAQVIQEMEAAVEEVLDRVSAETGIEFRMEPFQLTPGGQIPGALESELVTVAAAVSRHLGYEPSLSNAGSANLNVAIAAGSPAIGLGGSRGGDRGQPGEWADIDGMMRTARHVLLLAATLGG
ncbi:MAG: M20/M25/M40 family metallo-hydrolase [Gemmatimonadota bacterium]